MNDKTFLTAVAREMFPGSEVSNEGYTHATKAELAKSLEQTSVRNETDRLAATVLSKMEDLNNEFSRLKSDAEAFIQSCRERAENFERAAENFRNKVHGYIDKLNEEIK